MARRGLRFEPPAHLAVPEIAWVLARAFGPHQSIIEATNPSVALATARRLSLSARIVARSGRSRLAIELGPETADAFAADRAAVAARALGLRQTIHEVASTAASAGVPVAFLKFAALDLAGVLDEGSRPAADVDVLAPSGQAELLHEALSARGHSAAGAAAYEQHLPALAGPHGMVEVHRTVLGIRLSGRRSASWEALHAAGLLSRQEHLPGRATTPVPALLVAHALAHGMAQHGFAPQAYPLAIMLADLCDLGFGGAEGPRLLAALSPWLRRALPVAEIAAAQELAAGLSAGEGDRLSAGARVLLDHVLAGNFDAGYAQAMKLTRFRFPLSDRPRAFAALAGIATALFSAGSRRGQPPTGPGQRGRLGYLWRQARLGWLARRRQRVRGDRS